MGDTQESGAGKAPMENVDVRKAVADLQTLFATLVPPDTIQITDALGNGYTVRGVLPARSQIKLIQSLEKLANRGVEVAGGVSNITSGGWEGAGVVLLSLAQDEDVLDKISEAFASAHPAAVAEAVRAANRQGIDSDHPADLFPAEEMIRALVPFFVRFASRLVGVMGEVAGAQ